MTTQRGSIKDDHESGRKIAGAIARFERYRRASVHHDTLGTADLRLLWLMADGQPRTLRDIAHELSLEQSTINRQVNAALTQDIVERSRVEGQAAYVFSASELGIEHLEKHISRTLGGYEKALASMGTARAGQLLGLLEEFVDRYGELNEEDEEIVG